MGGGGAHRVHVLYALRAASCRRRRARRPWDRRPRPRRSTGRGTAAARSAHRRRRATPSGRCRGAAPRPAPRAGRLRPTRFLAARRRAAVRTRRGPDSTARRGRRSRRRRLLALASRRRRRGRCFRWDCLLTDCGVASAAALEPVAVLLEGMLASICGRKACSIAVSAAIMAI